jgi:hypothetical protein
MIYYSLNGNIKLHAYCRHIKAYQKPQLRSKNRALTIKDIKEHRKNELFNT